MSTFGNIFGIHEQALQLRQERMRVLSENVANAETPNYKSKDIDFRAAMASTVKSIADLQRTHEFHMETRKAGGDYEVFRTPVNTAADGNTVEVHHQQMEFGKESSRYLATVQFIENRIGGIRRALKGE